MSGALARDPGVLVLGGPTAAGKSEIAAELARRLGGAVVCADSRQVYRGLEIGTAQPDLRLRGLSPHFLAGFLSPEAGYSAGRYGDDARRVIGALRARGVPVLLCGGTGLYLRAALGGLFREEPLRSSAADLGAAPLPDRAAPARAGRVPRAALTGRWEKEGGAALHAELARLDPALARRVHPGDRQRVLRGLAFHAATGGRLSRAWEEGVTGCSGTPHDGARCRPNGTPASGERETGPGALRFRLELSARELEVRIHARLESMLRAGLMGEARALHDRYGDDPPASLNAVGYSELFRHFEGKVSLDTALARIQLRTRQYAKRQRTWFRRQDGYLPLPAGEDALEALLAAWRARLA